MNRGQGFTAGAVVLGAALLRGGVSPPAPSYTAEISRGTFAGESARKDSAKETSAAGPWLASCNYWRPTGWTDPPAQAPAGELKSEDVDVTIKGEGISGKLHVSTSRQTGECHAGAWGIPQPSPNPITAIIVTVPDPVHSSLALDFDRNMDAIERAATDNRYLMSYSWLPWSVSPETGSPAPASAEEQHASEERERQPGIIILKPSYLPPLDPSEAQSAGSPSRRVIYLFLVAQTPALGINGQQMKRALAYENYLASNQGVSLSVRDPKQGVDVVGPIYSGSATSLNTALLAARFDDKQPRQFHVVGATSTRDAAAQVMARGPDGRSIRYISFGEDANLDEETVRRLFCGGGRNCGRLAFLTESGTLYGSALSQKKGKREPIRLQFPREISLLRNAQREQKTASDAIAATDPYLHLSLKNTGAEDSIAHFSRDHMPVSQEAQWLAIIRELKTRRIETVSISASNILDELFLTQLLHRDLPDARVVVFDTNDLLFTHVGDNGAYLGTIAETAYPMFGLPAGEANFASTWAEQFYNAVSFTLWDGRSARAPVLSSYEYPLPSAPAGEQERVRPPPLWMTVAGRDGFYPLGIVDPCGSERVPSDLPTVHITGSPADAHLEATPEPCSKAAQHPEASLARLFPEDRPSYPGFSWHVLCVVIFLFCAAHSLLLNTASFWSPTTRDLAIRWSDEPRRRAVYLNIATAMLVSMAIVTAVPAFCTIGLLHRSGVTLGFAGFTLLAGLTAAVSTLKRTLPFVGPPPDRRAVPDCRRPAAVVPEGEVPAGAVPEAKAASDEQRHLLSDERLYGLFHLLALAATLVIAAAWLGLCADINAAGSSTLYLGRFFAYRCLYPAAGVSPLLPVLLILFSWYVWAFFQTKRLRFSPNSRPMLPREIPGAARDLYVSQETLTTCSNPVHSCLFDNITCLLITRQLIRRAFPAWVSSINVLLAGFYVLLFGLFLFCFPINGLDRFLRQSFLHLTLYESLISAIFYPLLVIALTGALRMLVIWSSLRSGLLEPLERSPLRFAFSRLTNVAWTTMFKQNGVLEYWRDMTRSNQAIRQMQHCPDLVSGLSPRDPQWYRDASAAGEKLNGHIARLRAEIQATGPGVPPKPDRPAWNEAGDFLVGDDLPAADHRAFLNLMCAIECDYATFAEALLQGVLIPHWTKECLHPVEAEPHVSEAAGNPVYEAPSHIVLAEEFLALRYFSLIRSILINLRQLMSFVSVSFVLAIIAWHSYPFQPRQWIDWTFTALLFGLGAAVIWMFAQMHRNPILSRITGTQANELGSEFYLRIATFGAVPVLTWVASQFPAIGSTISRLLQSGSGLAK